jgi:hypothetical protein
MLEAQGRKRGEEKKKAGDWRLAIQGWAFGVALFFVHIKILCA